MSAEGQLGEILELIRASSPTEREQIFQALAKENDVIGLSTFRAGSCIAFSQCDHSLPRRTSWKSSCDAETVKTNRCQHTFVEFGFNLDSLFEAFFFAFEVMFYELCHP